MESGIKVIRNDIDGMCSRYKHQTSHFLWLYITYNAKSKDNKFALISRFMAEHKPVKSKDV